MNEIQIFNYQDKKVRTIQKDGEPWFVLRDVCRALTIADHKVAARKLDRDEVCQIPLIDAVGRQQDTTVISESGLYTIILRSDKAEAKPFRRWVTHEVLPSIRRTGTYSVSSTKNSVAPLQPGSASGVAQLLKVLQSAMKDNKQPPEVISQTLKVLCEQFGLFLPDNFVKVDPFQQQNFFETYLPK